MLCQLPPSRDPRLLTAGIPFADAGVYRLRDDLALVQSVDFFTPIVDDPVSYGRIAAANALSDLYAMGATPVTALNIVSFPVCDLGPDVLAAVLQGGAEAVAEAGAVIVGGHSVEDSEPKYGLAVTGTVHPEQLITTLGATPGDRLVLTKPLGTGILTTALKGEMLTVEEMAEALAGMMTLNRGASLAMQQVGVHACTDITGFGLLGHALELAEASAVGLVLETVALPLYPRAEEMLGFGLYPGGGHRNRDHYLPQAQVAPGVASEMVDLLCDPQTSGGLLMAVAPERHRPLLAALKEQGVAGWTIGQVTPATAGIVIR